MEAQLEVIEERIFMKPNKNIYVFTFLTYILNQKTN